MLDSVTIPKLNFFGNHRERIFFQYALLYASFTALSDQPLVVVLVDFP